MLGVSGRETAVLIRRSTYLVDEFGDDQLVDTETKVPGAIFDPGTSSKSAAGNSHEVVAGRLMVTQFADYILPAGTDVSAIDAIRRPNGDVYEVNGEPIAWGSPFTGWAPGVVLPLKRVTG